MEKEMIMVTSFMDEETLVNNIIDIPKEEDVIDLIKKIDEKMESWQFTEELYNYFFKEMKNK